MELKSEFINFAKAAHHNVRKKLARDRIFISWRYTTYACVFFVIVNIQLHTRDNNLLESFIWNHFISYSIMISEIIALNTSAWNITYSAKITCEVYNIYLFRYHNMSNGFVRLNGDYNTDLYNCFYIGNKVPTIYKTTKYLLILLYMTCKIYVDFNGLYMLPKMAE
jgi:hypothetical protein